MPVADELNAKLLAVSVIASLAATLSQLGEHCFVCYAAPISCSAVPLNVATVPHRTTHEVGSDLENLATGRPNAPKQVHDRTTGLPLILFV
jgi:hypothetical protein